MRRLSVFNHVSLDGYFVGANGDFSWAHNGNDDPEYAEFVAGNAGGAGQMLFGRVTYELMARYWPSPMADQHNPAVAKGMNRMAKVVFSRSLAEAAWSDTTLVRGELVSEVCKMKEQQGPDMVILGSGSIVSQLAPEKLIDEYQMMIDPVALGKGRTMFEGMTEKLTLKLVKTRVFKNGKILVTYEAT
ncbi:dihydrofolate reductase family protein [Granulicella sp. S190]|uniref:dihydrofolate reductase family protein n=1 Tax=Granulicella sp. S190 TaxID=1747226 RepID=UPI00131E5BE3|nr:dihydrofolate reductase family protein [Granulicella sp. S190]